MTVKKTKTFQFKEMKILKIRRAYIAFKEKKRKRTK